LCCSGDVLIADFVDPEELYATAGAPPLPGLAGFITTERRNGNLQRIKIRLSNPAPFR